MHLSMHLNVYGGDFDFGCLPSGTITLRIQQKDNAGQITCFLNHGQIVALREACEAFLNTPKPFDPPSRNQKEVIQEAENALTK